MNNFVTVSNPTNEEMEYSKDLSRVSYLLKTEKGNKVRITGSNEMPIETVNALSKMADVAVDWLKNK